MRSTVQAVPNRSGPLRRTTASCSRRTVPQQLAWAQRTPDLLIPGQWALEVKLASVNLLHPYEGNVSLVGDCLKLRQLGGVERKGVVVVGYEHTPPKIALAPLLDAFELVTTNVVGVRIGPRVQVVRSGLCHRVHQQLLVASWEVL